MLKKTYPRAIESVSAIIADVRAELTRLKLPQKQLVHSLLLTEECVASLIENVT